ncbi:hypothetical protein [Crocosphaera sp.]|uniref:hypothetical protein n=1 Tax=Crocosphaera sp. TaxID=2729996 RepID=UPI002604E626|nr:hypothetical protein [Crocosphaera sp.]MDJ0579893.1 hypothetical protein [Crocosphaera sp.]
MSRTHQAPQTPSPMPKKPNWFLILTIIGTVLTAGSVLVGLIGIPEFRCFLLNLSCPPQSITQKPTESITQKPTESITQEKVELYTRTESGELLGGVEVTVMGSSGPPEMTYTDDNGYGTVKIPSKGNVRVVLTKSGYPTQNVTINLENEQDLARTIRMSQSGQPEVIPSSKTPSVDTWEATATPRDTTIIEAVENQFMKMQISGISKNQNGRIMLGFVITNKTNEDLYLAVNRERNRGTITDNFGQTCSDRGLQGLASVRSSANQPDYFTLISPGSTITVGQTDCEFPTSTEFNASFPLVRYQRSTTNPAGEHTKFSVGFRGLKLPSNQ